MIAISTALILLIIAALHGAWALGITWPDRTGEALARRVAGFKGITRMPPPLSCLAVASAMVVAALLVLDIVPLPDSLRLLALVGLTAIFAFRGVLAYNTRWREMTPEEPFATLDRRYYGPLCLVIALGFAMTIVGKFGGTS
ncbi:MAG: DUF3995 domain-containing protein [Pseudomonadota bacterium]